MNVVIEKKCEEHYNLLNKHFKLFLDLKKFLSKDKYIIFTIRERKQLIGLCVVYSYVSNKKNNLCRIIYTVVEKEHRGKGYNGMLLSSVYNNAQENNIKYITAHIRKSNTPSLNSFLKNGYVYSRVPITPYKDKEEKIRVVNFIEKKTQSIKPDSFIIKCKKYLLSSVKIIHSHFT